MVGQLNATSAILVLSISLPGCASRRHVDLLRKRVGAVETQVGETRRYVEAESREVGRSVAAQDEKIAGLQQECQKIAGRLGSVVESIERVIETQRGFRGELNDYQETLLQLATSCRETAKALGLVCKAQRSLLEKQRQVIDQSLRDIAEADLAGSQAREQAQQGGQKLMGGAGQRARPFPHGQR